MKYVFKGGIPGWNLPIITEIQVSRFKSKAPPLHNPQGRGTQSLESKAQNHLMAGPRWKLGAAIRQFFRPSGQLLLEPVVYHLPDGSPLLAFAAHVLSAGHDPCGLRPACG